MNKKKIVKIISLLLICIYFFNIFSVSFADVDWANYGVEEKRDGKAIESTNNIIGAAIAVVRVVAVGVALIMLTVLAIKYMTAAPGEKATIKKSAVMYVVGAIVLFATSGILGIIVDFSGVIGTKQ